MTRVGALAGGLKYVAFAGMCFLALTGNDINFSTLSKESLLFCFCVIVAVQELLTSKGSGRYDSSHYQSTVKKDLSEFENFTINRKKSTSKGPDHILHRVTQDWNLDMRVAQDISKLIKLVVRDYILFWFVNVSKRNDFVVDVEEILTNAICTLVRRGKDLINPYMFVGDKVCDVLVRTMTLFRLACEKVRSEYPSVDSSSLEFQKLVANEFRNDGHLHIALMASTSSADDDKNKGKDIDGKSGFDGSHVSNHISDTFKHKMKHSDYNSASHLTVDEFFDVDRLASIESEYSHYVGGHLTKYLMDSKEENSKAGRHLFTDIVSNIILGSIYWLCSPSSVYYYIHMAVSMYRPENSTADGMDSLDPQSTLSELDLHIGMKAYFVGVAGEEKVSSSCCPTSIEAAAAIVLREGSPEEDSGYLPTAGVFILRQCLPPRTFEERTSIPSMLPALLCLSYIRPPGGDTNASTSPWQIRNGTLKTLIPVFDTVGLQLTDLNKMFSAKQRIHTNDKIESCDAPFPISFCDNRVGHVVLLTHAGEESGLCYQILLCSHQADLESSMRRNYSLVDNATSLNVSLDDLPIWSSFEEFLSAIQYVVPDGLQLSENDDSPHYEKQLSSADIQDAEDLSNEKTLLSVEKNILLNHELEGAVDEYLSNKFAPENKIIQISSNDESGKLAIARLVEAIQNVCIHGWLKKRFVALHPSTVSTCGVVSCREDGGRHIVASLSKMYSKILLKATPAEGTRDNTYEEFLNKSPVLWLWLSHTISHCRGPQTSSTKKSSAPGPTLADNSLTEKLNISQRCKCLRCNDVNCYVHSMEIFLEHHGSFFVDKEITLETYFECIIFCGLQTGKLVDILEITSLLMACEGDYSNVDAIVTTTIKSHDYNYCYSSTNVDAVRALSRHDFLVVPSDQFAEEAVLRCPSDSARAMSLILPLRDHYLHFFKGSTTDTSSRSESRSSHDVGGEMQPPYSPRTAAKEKKKSNVFKSMSQKTFSAATSLLDDISSLASTNRTTESEPPRPRHLTFSSNMDIIQVSNIKLETAQDKWHRKIGEGALFGSELQRKAEVAFTLRILLRDRPPLEFLESRKIIKRRQGESSRFSSFNIEILKYEKLASSSGQQVVVYYIDVYRRRPDISCPVHLEPGHEEERAKRASVSPVSTPSGRVRVYPHKCTCRKWTIKRRYTDFDELHKHLKSQIGHDIFNAFKLPQKAYVQVVQSSFFYAKRLMGLREYLRSLLTGLPDMTEVRPTC